ncbi:MAG TPA: dephospho-CoA kinase [Acidobacteriaceae bacterium]|nr:dephospho-CoA kinase [Acidobacteriaceae bacterium]
MLRVGLTGGLGSGKSTAAGIFRALGASVSSADEIGRALMQPGQPVYEAIVRQFGSRVVRSDGALDRRVLAEAAFQENQADALNRIVHPAVIAAEEEWMREVFARDPAAVAIVESALIFEAQKWGTAPGWLERFDKLILITVPDEVKIARFVAAAMAASPGGEEDRRAGYERDARARLARQLPDESKAGLCDYVISNSGTAQDLRAKVEAIYSELHAEARRRVGAAERNA